MKLEEVTAVLRPRGGWESADLGCALVRRHYPKVMLIWAITVLPVWAVILAIFRENLVAACFWIWLLLPLYGRAILFYISRALFGDTPRIGEVLRALPGLWSRGLIYTFTIGRLSVSRSFLLPVILLERPKWSAFKTRAQTLKLHGDGAFSLTFTTAMLSMAFMAALFGLGRMLTTSGVSPDWRMVMGDFFALLFQAAEDGDLGATVMAWLTVLYLASIAFIEPFYIGAGFGQYLDSRTHLEGWDVELGFKRLAGRLERQRGGGDAAKAAVLALGLLLVSGFGEAGAQGSSDAPETIIAEVLADEDFEIHTETFKQWESKRETKERSYEGGGASAAAFGDVLFWIIMIAAVIALGFLIYSCRHIFAGLGSPSLDDAPQPKARTVMGMDIAEETLPDDIPGAAWEAFKAGDVGRAMRLLYRGSLSWLVEREGLPVRESDTEGECVEHSQEMADPNRVSFFASMTGAWTGFAYGDEVPNEEEMGQLCKQWPFGRGKGGAQ